jgi:hypothetical protein
MTITILTSNELKTQPVFQGFYTINNAYTPEQAQARQAERQARRQKQS